MAMRSARDGFCLEFVPELIATEGMTTWLTFGGRTWEVTSWMPGRADFHVHPTRERLEAACQALAWLHRAWAIPTLPAAPCSAVLRRLQTLQRWHSLLDSGWMPLFTPGPLAVPSRRAWDLLRVWTPRIRAWLQPWESRPLRQGRCLCDVWHDHLLFEGDQLTGIVDYGALKLDHVAVDLARMLGSLVGDDDERWARGLTAYRVIHEEYQPLHPVMSLELLPDGEEALARALDRTGVILGASNWLRWLYHDGRQFDNVDAVVRRLTDLVERMERWQGGLVL